MRLGVLPLTICLILSVVGSAGAVETVIVTGSPADEEPQWMSVHRDGVDGADLSRFGPADPLSAIDRGLTGVSLGGASDDPFQPNLVYRGFEASSLTGDAQGLAVYLDGVRLNEPFGDTVDWSILPGNAVSRIGLETADPAFGLNALGGALSIAMRDGFDTAGRRIEASAGSFGRGEVSASFGGNDGTRGGFAAIDVLHDDGWRQHSPSSLARAYASFDWRDGTSRLSLDLLGAAGDQTGNGATPVELLAAQRNAVFTWPDDTRSLFGLATLRGQTSLPNGMELSGQVYLDGLGRRTTNGDASDGQPCDPPDGFLCLDDGTVLTDINGHPIPDFLAGAPYAQLNRTRTRTLGYGGGLQFRYRSPRWRLMAGFSVDGGDTDFSATSAIGALTADRGFAPPAIVIDQPDRVIAPVNVAAHNLYAGLFAQAAFDVTPELTLSAGARQNFASVSLSDRLGTALDGSHRYSRLDPFAGARYRIAAIATAYLSYAEANRAPTPAEFSCADASAPCSLTNFFVGDPALKQVSARTVEAGLRGEGGLLSWQADLWRTDTANDIVFAASALSGRAYFRNVGTTRRQGVEADAHWRDGRWSADASYSYTLAQFRSPVTLESPDNPLADATGSILVRPGNRLPGVPEHLAKLTLAYAPAQDIDLSLAVRYLGGVYLQGDEANLNPPTAPYIVVDLGARCRISDGLELFGAVDNLFDRKYATFGTFSPTADVPIAQVPGASDPRSLSPGTPRAFEAGLRLSLN